MNTSLLCNAVYAVALRRAGVQMLPESTQLLLQHLKQAT